MRNIIMVKNTSNNFFTPREDKDVSIVKHIYGRDVVVDGERIIRELEEVASVHGISFDWVRPTAKSANIGNQ